MRSKNNWLAYNCFPPSPPPSLPPLPPSLRHAQVLASIQAFIHWLSEFYLTSERSNGQYTETIVWFTSLIVDVTHPLITRDIPEKVILSACQLLLSLATTVRPKFCLSLPGVKELTKKAREGELGDIPHMVRRGLISLCRNHIIENIALYCTCVQAQCMVYRALTNMLVLPWPETSDSRQEWAWRTAELGRVVAGATKVLTELQQSGQWNQEAWLLQQGV